MGEQWGREAGPGWVFGLSGDLGAGKTQLVKGIARGLGAPDRVHSPTFALVNVYQGGRLPLYHIDLYRLDDRGQIVGAGLEEFLDRPDGVAAVEWAEKWTGPAGPGPGPGPRRRDVRIEILGENERRICYEDSGS